MSKQELLKTIGFSDEFIQHLDNFIDNPYEVKSIEFSNKIGRFHSQDIDFLVINTFSKNYFDPHLKLKVNCEKNA